MKYHILNLIFMTTFLFSQPLEDWCLVLQTNSSGVFQGIATVNGVPAEKGDWIGAVDSEGNCAGATALTMDGGDAYINLYIYGDYNLTPDVDEGMNPGEDFVLRFWDSSEDVIYVILSLSTAGNLVTVPLWITVEMGIVYIILPGMVLIGLPP